MKKGLIGNFDIYVDSDGNEKRVPNWVSTTKVMKDLKENGLIDKKINVNGFYKKLENLNVLKSNYSSKVFLIKYSSWSVTEEYEFLINKMYIKPYSNGFQWSVDGIQWIKKFLRDTRKTFSL